MATTTNGQLARNVRQLARMDMPGGGQVVVQGDYAYVGHMEPPHGTSIVDVSDPRRPKLVSRIELPDAFSHSHKARVVGDIMIVNNEQFRRNLMRKGAELPAAGAALKQELGRTPTDGELAARLQVRLDQLSALREAGVRGYQDGGFKVYDITNRSKPRLLAFQKTHGVGVHRFDMDARYAYLSTEKEGFQGNILSIYDIADPDKPVEVGNWWMAGQHVAGGEQPHWEGNSHRLHHTLRQRDRIYASCWQGGFAVVDASDITRPTTLATHNYHPPVQAPTHTVMPVPQPIGGREVALVIDEEIQHAHGQPHACLWVFDIGDLTHIHPLASFHVGEGDSPYSRVGGRFGAHQFQEHMEGSLAFVAWFSGGLRIVDVGNPLQPEEVGHFIPEPGNGHAFPQSNDVEVDGRGLIYVIDRLHGLDILEYTG